MIINRTVDALGRIVIPKEMRLQLGIKEDTSCQIQLIGNKIVITNSKNSCVFCGSSAEIEVHENRCVCKKCADIILKGRKKND